jgi:hypothetical protein
MRAYRHLDTITAIFVAVLLISNVASTKIVDFGIFSFDGGTLLFPLAYIFGDILTEVYGYARSRRVIWLGFMGSALMAGVLALVNFLPAAADWPYQEAFQAILGQTLRIVAASLIAYFAGEFANSYILAKLKIAMAGKHLWIRTIGSTLIGEGLDTIIFCLIAFYGAFDNQLLLVIIASNYVFKVGVEVLFTPFTYAIVGFLKRAESEDYYDKKTNFNPFRLEV